MSGVFERQTKERPLRACNEDHVHGFRGSNAPRSRNPDLSRHCPQYRQIHRSRDRSVDFTLGVIPVYRQAIRLHCSRHFFLYCAISRSVIITDSDRISWLAVINLALDDLIATKEPLEKKCARLVPVNRLEIQTVSFGFAIGLADGRLASGLPREPFSSPRFTSLRARDSVLTKSLSLV